MADRVRKALYCYVVVPNRAGQGAKILGALAEAGVDLLAYSGFPAGGGRAQLDFVAPRLGDVKRALHRMALTPSATKRCFVIQGEDRVGALHRHIAKLGAAGISITAADAVAGGKGRYGVLLWVKPGDYAKAARVLGAK
jgi:hypothetical protein